MLSFSIPQITLEQILEKLADITLRIQQGASLQEIFQCTVDQSRAILNSDRVVIVQLSQPGQSGVCAESVGIEGIPSLRGLIETMAHPDQWFQLCQQDAYYQINDRETDALSRDDIDLFVQLRIRASLTVPIPCHNQVWGVLMAHHCEQARQWQPLDLQLLKQIALQLGIAIQQVDLQQPIQRDTPELGQTDLALRAVRDRLQYLLSYASVVLFTCQPSGMYPIIDISSNVTALLGYEPHHFTEDAHFYLDQIHPEDINQVLDSFSQVLINSYAYCEFRFLHANGTYRWLTEELTVIRDQMSQPIELMGYLIDISDHKAVQDALYHSEERFRIVQDLSLDAFTLLKSIRDQTGKIIDFEWTYVNPKAAELLKRPIAELVGHRLLEVLPGNQTNSELFQQYVQVVETGVSHDLEIFYNAEGITGWFRNMTVKLEDGVAISFNDITQRKQTEEALRESTEQLHKVVAELKQLNHTKDEFLSTVSHELRTPMTNIKMSIRMLELSLLQPHSAKKDQRIQQYLQILGKECDREINLINDLLDLQRLDAGHQQTRLESIHIFQWLIAFVKPFQERAIARQQNLLIQLPDANDATEIWCDLKSLERIIGELLNNACKYTPPGQEIVVTAQLSLKQLHIQVINFGVEIPSQALPHIFDRFYRVPSADPWQQGGTGLGLALVKKLVECLNGTIQVESHSGCTCFHLLLAVPENAV